MSQGIIGRFVEQCRERYPSECAQTAERTNERRGEDATSVMLGMMQLVLVIGGLAIVIVLLFVHPLLALLAGILIAIIWHGLRTSRN
jgi:hypothetical protein